MNKYHFIGIGGIGMSALARILLQKGACVSGSDRASTEITKGLKALGAQIFERHLAEHVTPEMTLIFSSSIPKNNPEYEKAISLNLPILHRSEMLSELMHGKRGLLVTGTHGKTTTSGLLAYVLSHEGLDPAYAIGGIIKSLKGNGAFGSGEYFVAEADESDGSFLHHPAYGAIITNLEREHLDFWKTQEALIEGFREFASHVEGPLFWCSDDPGLKALSLSGYRYGFEEGADLQILSFTQRGWKSYFDLAFKGKTYSNIELNLIGKHNVLNAAAVFGLAMLLNVSEHAIRQSFKTFEGMGRRADYKGSEGGIDIYDDYGHHPTEIAVTLRGIRAAIQEKRLIVAFQPHRFTRTQDLYREFGPAFKEADLVIITEIYSAGEAPIPGITSDLLIKEIAKESHPLFCPRDEIVERLAEILKAGNVLVTQGAGDITAVAPLLLDRLKKVSC
jgi:UDP-N-acetylmuramate--L-alanine ligase